MHSYANQKIIDALDMQGYFPKQSDLFYFDATCRRGHSKADSWYSPSFNSCVQVLNSSSGLKLPIFASTTIFADWFSVLRSGHTRSKDRLVIKRNDGKCNTCLLDSRPWVITCTLNGKYSLMQIGAWNQVMHSHIGRAQSRHWGYSWLDHFRSVRYFHCFAIFSFCWTWKGSLCGELYLDFSRYCKTFYYI